MFQHNLVLIFRNFKKHKSTFFINLTGLSVGLCGTILIFLWVKDEMQVDKFHEKDAQLYQIKANHHNSNEVKTISDTPDLLAETMEKELPEVEMSVSMMSSTELPKFTLSVGEEKTKAAGQFSSPNFFQIFSYPLIAGDAGQVLKNKNAVVISEKLAMKLFKTTENVVGKTIDWQITRFGNQGVVSGIFKDVPAGSTEQFDFVLTTEMFRDPVLFRRNIHWGNHAPSTFLVLKPGTDLVNFNKKIDGFIQTKLADSNVRLFAVPYSSRYLYGKYENGKLAGGRIAYVKLFSIIALFILLIACINFMNLSTAKAALKIKEVGIKKTIGITRKSLIFQYLGESIAMAFLSLFLALFLASFFLPVFNEITGKQLALSFDLKTVLSLISITIFTGFIAGSYPAFYLSGFSPATVLSGKINKNMGELWARKGLVVLQFSISILFIVAVMVVYKQIELVQTKNLGLKKDHVINFEIEGNLGKTLDVFLSEVKKQPGVVNASSLSSSFDGSSAYTIGVEWEGKQPDETVNFGNISVGYDLIETLGMEMADGRGFSKNFGADSSKLIFNETAIAAMRLQNPVGKTVKLWGKDAQIIGVVKDFHSESLHEPVKPMIFRIDPRNHWKIVVKMEAGKESETIENVRRCYQKFNPGYAFDYVFLDEVFQKQYVAEMRVAVLSRYFAGLAILLSCLGLFGLAAFTAEQRRKEIGIRKVLGASVAGITSLLAKDFLKLVVVAIFIASPVAYYFMKNWLSDFAYRVDIQWWMFAVAGAAAVGIAFLTVSFQSIKAALANPVKSLRSE